MGSTRPDGEGLNYGIVLPNWIVDGHAERLVDYGVAAEAAGWDAVFLADHLVLPPSRPDEDVPEDGAFPDPWITLAGIAARTEEMQPAS